MTRFTGNTLRPISGRRMAEFLVVLATALLAGGCSGEGSDAAESGPTTAAESRSTTAAESAAPASAEVGTWQTAPITKGQFLQTLKDSGFQRYSRHFASKQHWLPKREAVLSLELRAGSWTLYAELDGEPPTVFDRQSYEVVDERFELTSGAGHNVFQPKIEDETLTLEFVSTTEPPVGEVPAEAVLRVYYMTAPFQRVES